MDIKRLFSSNDSENDAPLVRIEGSLSGDAFQEKEILDRLRETVAAVSERRPYSYDLDFSAGRFSIIILESMVPKSDFSQDPADAISQDLQNIIEALSPEQRTKTRCTFRMMWREGGEVFGVAFLVAPPGRVEFEQRLRPEEEYDRIADEQALGGLTSGKKNKLPKWATISILAVIVGLFLYLYITFSPDNNFTRLENVLIENAELSGLEDLIRVSNPQTDRKGLYFTVSPCEDYDVALKAALKPDEPENTEGYKKKLAAQALIVGRLNLEIFDEMDNHLSTITFHLKGFNGKEPVEVFLKRVFLRASPHRVRIAP